jgi:hypothetical protein
MLDVHLLQYADDVVVISNNSEQLNDILTKCLEHSVKNIYSYNPAKCVAFSDQGAKLGNDILQIVESFNYLGIPFTRGGINQNLFYAQKLQKAEGGIIDLNKMGIFHHVDINKKVRIYKQLIRPRVEYGLGLMTKQNTRTRAIDDKLHRLYSSIVGTSTSVSKLGLRVTLGLESTEMRRCKLMTGVRDRLMMGLDDCISNPTKLIYSDLSTRYHNGTIKVTGHSPRLLQIAAQDLSNCCDVVHLWNQKVFTRLYCPGKYGFSKIWLSCLRYVQLYILARFPGAIVSCKLCNTQTRSFTSHTVVCNRTDIEIKRRVELMVDTLKSKEVDTIPMGILMEFESLLRLLKALMEG